MFSVIKVYLFESLNLENRETGRILVSKYQYW